MDRLQHYYGSLVDCWLATNEGGEATIRSPPSLRFHRTHHGPAAREIYLIVTITDWENADLYKGS